MILVIDNYDSFTYNLVQYLGELGARMEVVRNDALDADAIAAMRPERVVISPGPGTPDQAGVSIEVIRRLGGTTPILGVCLGHQAIGRAFGATVARARTQMHGKTSAIRHDGRGVFAGLSNPFVATRYHSLAVVRGTVPPDLEVTAEAGDGEIMGLRHRRWPIEGVQFHPESILTVEGKTLLGNFLGAGAAG
ncbi:MAG: aminodeoxychorismate/anthranilate synthase component II [Candidatus Rokubacteria bacterium]|nr:aminodeoxychorismate/anthranilate synthase component II [Candidatus Rokubacteria bacterium]